MAVVITLNGISAINSLETNQSNQHRNRIYIVVHTYTTRCPHSISFISPLWRLSLALQALDS